MLRSMWRELETGPRSTLAGHEGGNPGYRQANSLTGYRASSRPYQANAKGKMLPGGWLFPSRDPVCHLSTRQLNRALHMAADNAELDKRVSMHTLRHSFATHLLERKVDIRIMAAALFESLIINRPFLGGKRRVGFFATDVFLRLNGWRLVVEAAAAHKFRIGLLDRRECSFQNLLSWIDGAIRRL
jgi:prophage maintenance system killer protein